MIDREQCRLIKGNKNGFSINTVDHKDGKERIDVSITYLKTDEKNGAVLSPVLPPVLTENLHLSAEQAPVSTLSTGTSDLIIYAHNNDDFDHDKFFAAYTPEEEDGCYIQDSYDEADHYENINPTHRTNIDRNMNQNKRNINTKENSICWWHMSDGRVLGVHNGMVLEYDHLTLAPLGLVVGRDQLKNRYLAIVDSGIELDQIKLKLQDWTVPNFVILESRLNERQNGFTPNPGIPIKDLDEEILDELCNNFRRKVFEKAGKNDPHVKI